MRDLGDAVEQLGDVQRREEAVQAILAAGAAAIPFLRRGLSHPFWRIRHMSCRLLDDLPLDVETLRELRARAESDANKRVRHQAWHAITCEPCKPGGVDLTCELGPLDAVAGELRDQSLRVRRAGATGLIFAAVTPSIDTTRLRELIDATLARETDATIVGRARRALAALERAQATSA